MRQTVSNACHSRTQGGADVWGTCDDCGGRAPDGRPCACECHGASRRVLGTYRPGTIVYRRTPLAGESWGIVIDCPPWDNRGHDTVLWSTTGTRVRSMPHGTLKVLYRAGTSKARIVARQIAAECRTRRCFGCGVTLSHHAEVHAS